MKKTFFTLAIISCAFSLAIAQEITTNAQREPQAAITNVSTTNTTLVKKAKFNDDSKRIKTLKKLSLEEISIFAYKLYKNRMFKELYELYKNNKKVVNTIGKHNYTMALFFFKTKRFRLFYKQALFYLINKKDISAFRRRLIKKHLAQGNYKKVINTILSSHEYPKLNKNSYYLLIHSLLKEKKYKEAHRIIRNKILSEPNPSSKEMTLIMKLALKLKDGSEAAFWGNEILAKQKQQKLNPILLNNMAIAYLYQYQTNNIDKKSLQISLDFHQKSLELKKSLYSYHTGSLIYEAKGNLKKALYMLKFCRALNPRDKNIISRYRSLQRKNKKGHK